MARQQFPVGSASGNGEEADRAPLSPTVPPSPRRSSEPQPRQLSPLLVWAVVFCDIGTSVYYVPGILHSQVGALAPLFIIATVIGFVPLAVKYQEICWRNPEGGGVVSVATKAFTPRWGVFGGFLILVSYFFTIAISSVSGLHYLATIFPPLRTYIVTSTVGALIFLATINIIGIRESALLSLTMAVAALLVDLVVIGVTVVSIGPPEWETILRHVTLGQEVSWYTFLVGFAGAWLAFSGLESISQLSPAMRAPIKSTARNGMILVVVSILCTSPLLSLFSVALLPDPLKVQEPERFISHLGAMWGGVPVELAVVGTASVLLLFAANTGIIGAYHVFLALASGGFFPQAITWRNRRFGTPHLAIGVATFIPIAVVIATQAHLEVLADLYVFGLLGAFVMSSAGLDMIRWRLRQRHVGFWIGVLTTGMVAVAWAVNIVEKFHATIFGGALVAVGMLISVTAQQGRFADLFYGIPLVARLTSRRILEAEREAEEIPHLVSLSEASELLPLYPSRTLVAVRGRNLRLIDEAIAREKGWGGNVIYALYVEERPGLFVGTEAQQPDEEGIITLRFAAKAAQRQGFELIPVWTVSYNAAEAIARAAEILEVDTVMMGVSRRSAIYHLLRGHVVNGLTRRLPPSCHLLLFN
ncbi:MAG: APC family permease [Candidatus Binatia bacterium]|nr:APC family permease [Candidatus Binatia bacterium]